MASVGLDTGGSQFYISLSPNTHMNGRCVVFGRMDPAGEPILAAIEKVCKLCSISILTGFTKVCKLCSIIGVTNVEFATCTQVFTFRGVPSTDVVIKASGVL